MAALHATNKGTTLSSSILPRSVDRSVQCIPVENRDRMRIERGPSWQSIPSPPSYSDTNGVSGLISQFSMPATQPNTPYDSGESVPPSTEPSFSSLSSLGKRKASELSDFFEQSQPGKIVKSTNSIHDASNPFLDTHDIVSAVPLLNGASSSITPVIIAHSPHHQSRFDQHKISFGVQYEIARLYSSQLLKYEDITLQTLINLRGPSAIVAPDTPRILRLCERNEGDEAYALAFAKEMAAKTPWEELDIEERNLRIDPLSGLGFGKDTPGWYGGKVHFRAKLKEGDGGRGDSHYKIRLERAELGPSCRFARRFGSTSFLKVKVPSNIINRTNNGLTEFFSRPFILNGRVFRSFFAKEENVFLFRTNEVVHDFTVAAGPAGSPGLSLMEFLNWHNSLEVNRKQSLTKWASRFALGLSTSVPALELKASNIVHEPDIMSTSGSDMTDGAGFINKLPLLEMQARFEWGSFPTAIQCRLAGSKGLLHVQPNDRDDAQENPVAHIRPSQIKIKYPPEQPADPAMLILDLLCSSHMRSPSRLSHEITINLAENGVHHSIFAKLFRQGLTELIDSLMKWDDPLELWRTISHKGGVLSARMAREAGGESRARGYGERENDDLEHEDEDGLGQMEKALKQSSTAWWWDELSGCPSSLEETVMVLLDAGFLPTNCPVLRDKLKHIVLTSVETYTRKCKVDVPMSCTAFIVPDPFGVLGPREVQIRNSRRSFQTEDGIETDVILGDVLLARHPCKLPTDVQKFQAVEKVELRHLTDVIVCSTQGDRRQADLLSGGDYDGDKVLAVWQPDVVKSFVNADLRFSHEPKEVDACFDCEQGSVGEFLEQMGTQPEESQIQRLQKVLLGNIRDGSVVGTYSKFHESSIYAKGYNHPQTVHLAYMFCKILDGAKTGLTVKQPVLRKDRSEWQRTLPPRWKEITEDKKKIPYVDRDNRANLRRPPNLHGFIMDRITKVAREERTRQLHPVREKFDSFNRVVADSDLTEPWLSAVKLADRFVVEEGCDRMKRDLEKIADHVHSMFPKHRGQVSGGSPKKSDNRAPFSDLPIEVRQDKIRALSREFHSKPSPREVMMDGLEIRRLRASYAYYYDHQKSHGKGWTRFPFDVAMRDLCTIKAQALGPSRTITAEFYQRFYLK